MDLQEKIVSYKTYIAKILVNCSEKSNRLIINYEDFNICETELQGVSEFVVHVYFIYIKTIN